MAIQALPCDQTGLVYYEFQTQLEGVQYTFSFRWNERAAAWFMEIDDANGDPLLCGRRVVCNWPLLARFKDPSLPPGELFAYDTTGQSVDPGANDLGGRVSLLYFESTGFGYIRVPTGP